MQLTFNDGSSRQTAPNPIRDLLTASPDAQSLYRKIDIPATDLSTTFIRVGGILESLWAKITQLEANQDYKVEVIAQQKADARNAALQALDTEYSDDVARRQAILDDCNAVINPPAAAKDPGVALLAEMQLQRAWARALRTLDAAPDDGLMLKVDELAKAAVKDNDSATRAAFRQELPAYLATRNRTITPDMLAQMEMADLSPAARMASQAVAELERGWSGVQACFWIARRYASDTTGERITSLPGWGQQYSIVF